jgi:type IV pilus assembly protein PilN
MIRINLLKPETKDIKEETEAQALTELSPKKAPNFGSLILLLLVVVLGAFFYLQQRAFDRENDLLAFARQEKAKLKYVTAKLEEQKTLKASLERKINLINDLRSQQDLAVRIMDQLSRSLPDWVWLTEVTYDSKGLQIKGKALSNNLIADYMTSLENSSVLMSVSLISSTQRRSQRSEYLEFSLSAQIEKAPPPAPVKTQPAVKQRGTP